MRIEIAKDRTGTSLGEVKAGEVVEFPDDEAQRYLDSLEARHVWAGDPRPVRKAEPTEATKEGA